MIFIFQSLVEIYFSNTYLTDLFRAHFQERNQRNQGHVVHTWYVTIIYRIPIENSVVLQYFRLCGFWRKNFSAKGNGHCFSFKFRMYLLKYFVKYVTVMCIVYARVARYELLRFFVDLLKYRA